MIHLVVSFSFGAPVAFGVHVIEVSYVTCQCTANTLISMTPLHEMNA